MIITLSGITGCGKSYYKNFIKEKVNAENMVIYTTRKKREKEINGIDKNFVTKEQFEELEKKQEFFASYDFLGEKYGYGKKYINDNKLSVTELHYEWIKEFKKKAENVYSIYIVPTNIEEPIRQLKKRNLPQEIEEKRLKEIQEHILKIKNNQDLKNQFDITFYNDYTKKSDEDMIKILNKIMSIGTPVLDIN